MAIQSESWEGLLQRDNGKTHFLGVMLINKSKLSSAPESIRAEAVSVCPDQARVTVNPALLERDWGSDRRLTRNPRAGEPCLLAAGLRRP